MSATQTVEIVSIGCAAAELQAPVASIRRAAEVLGIEPAFRINEVAHYVPADLERIGERIRQQREAR